MPRLQRLTDLLRIDWRDVMMAGEYEYHRTGPVRIRDLSEFIKILIWRAIPDKNAPNPAPNKEFLILGTSIHPSFRLRACPGMPKAGAGIQSFVTH
jgi:hypothetical protein